jgi:putative inorganic carbon (hco3(-)) transporter
MITSPSSRTLGQVPRFNNRVAPTRSVREAHVEAMWELLRALVYGILLTRASCDLIFDWLGLGGNAGSMGVGAILNALAIVIAFSLVARRPLTAPFAIFAIWGPLLLTALFATLRAPDFGSAARLAMVILSYWAFFAIPFFIWRNQGDLSRFLLLVIGSSIFPSLYALVDIARGLSTLSDFRLQSTFAHANIYAFYLVLLIGIALYVRSSQIIRVSARLKLLITLYIPFLLALLMLTGTRSAWLACGLMLLVYASRIDRRVFAGLLLAPVLLAANPGFYERLTEVTNETAVDSLSQLNESTHLNSYVWRQILWESAIPQILEKPLMGHGLETFRPSTPSFFPLVGPEGIDGHNFYLQTAFEMGLIGLVALLWLLGSVARQILKGRRRDPTGMLIMLCILIGYALESYSDNMHFYLSFNWYFWFAMGTICAWVHNEEKAPPAEGRR